MDRQLDNHELISDLMDGELDEAHLDQLISLLAEDDEASLSWEVYHLTRDVLRHGEASIGGVALSSSPAFMASLRQRLQHETIGAPAPEVIRPVLEVQPALTVQSRRVEAANAPVFRWRLVAGVASIAAVAAVGWALVVTQNSTASGGALLAQVQPAAAPAMAVATTSARPGDEAVMLRDPQLDELLAAHKQFAGSSALQSPAGFLRNATFEGPAR